jgi:hypothetical protein
MRLPPEHIGRAHRRDGFEAASADRIFESTFTEQTQKRGAAVHRPPGKSRHGSDLR